MCSFLPAFLCLKYGLESVVKDILFPGGIGFGIAPGTVVISAHGNILFLGVEADDIQDNPFEGNDHPFAVRAELEGNVDFILGDVFKAGGEDDQIPLGGNDDGGEHEFIQGLFSQSFLVVSQKSSLSI